MKNIIQSDPKFIPNGVKINVKSSLILLCVFINKNPQKDQVDYVDWIELIKFKETRNYVQRVLENYNVYRYILEQKPIKLKEFFKDDPLY